MNSPTVSYSNCPVVEAIVDIDCDLPQYDDAEKISVLAKKALEPKYSIYQKQIIHNTKIEQDDVGSPTKVKIVEGTGAYQFLTEDERQLCLLYTSPSPRDRG